MAALEQTVAQAQQIEAHRPVMAALHEWVISVDHKRLGLMYICAGLVFFAIAGLEASLMRWQLAVPNNEIVSPAVFNRLFTMHGTTMVFLVGMPIILGLANYLVPLMIGARDLAFPRLNAFGFWLFLFSGLQWSNRLPRRLPISELGRSVTGSVSLLKSIPTQLVSRVESVAGWPWPWSPLGTAAWRTAVCGTRLIC